MKLNTLKLNNFRCFSSLDISFERITLLLADNGGGKSTILEAVKLAFGSYLSRLPDISGVKPVKEKHLRIEENGKRSPYLRITTVLDNGVEWDRTERRDQSQKTLSQIPKGIGIKPINEYADSFIDKFNDDQKLELPIVLYYGTERTLSEEMPKRRRNWQKDFTPFDALKEALNGKTNFRRFLEWFHEMEDQESREQKALKDFNYSLKELDVVREAITTMIPGYSNPRIETKPLRFVVDHEGIEFNIDQLSDGYRITLAMIADIAGRLAEANPGMKNPLQACGIVMIDEVDQHLHPKWQRRIVSDLHRTFQNVQFILTTHSPIVALGAPEECKIIHIGDQHEIRELPKSSLEQYSADRILVSALFGLPHPNDPVWDNKIDKRNELLKSGSNPELLRQLNNELYFLNAASEEESEDRRIIREAAEILRQSSEAYGRNEKN